MLFLDWFIIRKNAYKSPFPKKLLIKAKSNTIFPIKEEQWKNIKES